MYYDILNDYTNVVLWASLYNKNKNKLKKKRIIKYNELQ